MNYFDLMVKVADTYVKYKNPKTLSWSWGEALVMYCLSLLDDELDEKRYFEFYKEYADTHYESGIVIDQSDTLAPVLVTNELYKKTKDKKYLEMTNLGIDYLLNEPRLIEGLINHNGHSKDSKDYPKSIWVDSMMMSGVFSVIAATEYNNSELLEFAKTQPMLYAKYLQDVDTKLFHHSYWKILKRPYPRNLFWGRGNGWVVASLSLFLEYVKDEDTLALFKEVSKALLKYQRDDYYFDTVLNKSDNYRESSGTALIAFAWLNGCNNGDLDKKYGELGAKAYEAIIDNLLIDKESYMMTEISKWTIPMFIAPYRLRIGPYPGYKYVKKGNNIPYGVAALILAGISYKRYLKQNRGQK